MRELEEVSGVGPGAAKKLRDAYVTTAELLAVQNPVELHARTNVGEGTAVKIVRNAQQLVGMLDFRSGIDVEKDMIAKPKLKTGLEKVDKQLMGGIDSGSLVEFYGPARGGKTQWSSYLAVRSQLSEEEGGLAGRVLWLDSESSFKPGTIRAIAVRFGLDPETILGNIGYASIHQSGQIESIFEKIPQMCAENGYKLVIVDSFSGLFRQEFMGLASLRLRQQSMNALLNQMRRATHATDAIFVYTNQVMAKISNYGGYDNAPIGGHILSHASDYRFYTTVGKSDDRRMVLKDNAGVPEFEVTLKIGWGGFFESAASKKALEPKIVETLLELDETFADFKAEVEKESKKKTEKKAKEKAEKAKKKKGVEKEVEAK